MKRKALLVVLLIVAVSLIFNGSSVKAANPKKYAVLINGSESETRYWKDIDLMYSVLVEDCGFSQNNIFLLNGNGQNPEGKNPNGMIDYPAKKKLIEKVFKELAQIIDEDDLLFIFITDHGMGYSGPGDSCHGFLYSYCASIDGDEKDYLEKDFKLRAFSTSGRHHGMNEWVVYNKYDRMYRNKYVSHFTDVYVEKLDKVISDNDIFIERFIDYLMGDTNRDGKIGKGETRDFNKDGVINRDDWGEIDDVEEINFINTGVPGDSPYVIFDANLDNRVDIDLNVPSEWSRDHSKCNIEKLQIDGTDVNNDGLFDSLNINDDEDRDDWISIDEKFCTWDYSISDDEMAEWLDPIDAGEIVVVMLPCYSGGFVEDLSAPGRIIMTATGEETFTWGNAFVRNFAKAIRRRHGEISMVEAFNHAAKYSWEYDTSCYDDNGDGIGHGYPIPNGGDGKLGSETSLKTLIKGDVNRDGKIDVFSCNCCCL